MSKIPKIQIPCQPENYFRVSLASGSRASGKPLENMKNQPTKKNVSLVQALVRLFAGAWRAGVTKPDALGVVRDVARNRFCTVPLKRQGLSGLKF